MQELLFSLIGGAIALGVPWLFKTFLPGWQVSLGDRREHNQELENAEKEHRWQRTATEWAIIQQESSRAWSIADEAISWGREEITELRKEIGQIRELYSQVGNNVLILTNVIRELRDGIRKEKRTRR